jgi:hypothetical protein
MLAPTPSARYALIGLGLFALIIIRFPRVAIALTRLILGPPSPPANLPRIFRGPRPFGPQESAVFPGRRAEIDDCCQLVQQSAFSILEGESGSEFRAGGAHFGSWPPNGEIWLAACFHRIGLISLVWLPGWIKWMPRGEAMVRSLPTAPGFADVLRQRSFGVFVRATSLSTT